MRVTFFGSGSPLSAMALRSVAARHEVPLVVMPEQRLGRRARLKRLFGLHPPTPLEAEARRLGLPTTKYAADRVDAIRRSIRDSRTDLIAVASFPAILPAPLLETPGVNLHQSLLPRHRGLDPLFWTFHADDRDAGVSIHWLDSGVDTGDVISQQSMPVARGTSLLQLYLDLGNIGAPLLASAIDAIDSGTATRTKQDAARGFRDPSPAAGTWRIESDHWTAERTWHFLRGIGEMYGHLCRDASSQSLPLGGAREYQNVVHDKVPGTHEETATGVRLYCRDGVVDAMRPTRRPSGRH